MTHTEESLIELADAAMWQASLQSGDDKYKALRLAIREVLAERDRYLDIIRREAWLEHASENDVESPYVPFTDWVAEKKRAERAEAEVERLRNDLSVHKRLLDDKIADCISWINENERLRKEIANLDYRAVRQALERALVPCNSIVEFFHGSENMHALHIRERDTAKEIADAIRAMIEEYK